MFLGQHLSLLRYCIPQHIRVLFQKMASHSNKFIKCHLLHFPPRDWCSQIRGIPAIKNKQNPCLTSFAMILPKLLSLYIIYLRLARS